MKNVIIIENVRSAYNVGNIIRTADALGRDIIISGYSPSPFKDPKVTKSSLGAENHIQIEEFRQTKSSLQHAQELGYILLAAEITPYSLPLDHFLGSSFLKEKNLILTATGHVGSSSRFAVVVGNEVEGVLQETLDIVNYVVHIPMKGQKASLNVGQAAAIFMRELSRNN